MKKLIPLFTLMITMIGCDPQPLPIENVNVIWIDIRQDPPRILFSDLSASDPEWQEFDNPDLIPGFQMDIAQGKHPHPVRVSFKSDRPVAGVKYSTTILRDKNQKHLDIHNDHDFGASVDSVGVFNVVFKND